MNKEAELKPCREAFEQGMHEWDMTRIGDGYKNPYVEAMYVGWRAGWIAAQAQLQAYVELEHAKSKNVK